MNKIILVGRLTKDTEMVTTSNMTNMGKFTLAVNRNYAKENEEIKTDFFNVVTFGKKAEFATKYFKKGQKVIVFGRAEINNYEDQDGNKKTAIQIVAEELLFADTKKEESDNNTSFGNLEDLYDNDIKKENTEETDNSFENIFD